MRKVTSPPTSTRCIHCGGELRLKRIEATDPIIDLDMEVLVCVGCGCEQVLTYTHTHSEVLDEVR
jgi:uncharacterized protein with PIN domain